MDMTPRVSMIMPVYNAAAYLEAAVFSVLGQSFADLELICVNDRSTDESGAMLEALAQRDPRLRVIHAPENGGPGRARNMGLLQARGEWIGFIDADDGIPAELLRRAMERLDRDGQNGIPPDEIVWGLRELYCGADGSVKKERVILPEDGCYRGAQIPFAAARLEELTLFGYQCNSLYRGDIIRKNGLSFPADALYEDLFFNLDFIRLTRAISTMAYCGYDYKKRAGSVTHRHVPDYYELSEKRISRFYDYLAENGAAEERTLRVLRDRMLRYVTSALARDAGRAAGLSPAERRSRAERIKTAPILHKLLFEYPGGISAAYLPAALLLKYFPAGVLCFYGRAVRLLTRGQ